MAFKYFASLAYERPNAFPEVNLKLRREPFSFETMGRLSELNNDDKLAKLKLKMFYPME
jgi:hypothetical protein